MEYISIIRNRIMSSYYYTPQQTLLKQPSQLTLSHQFLHRSTLPDCSQDNKHYIHFPLQLMQSQIICEPSAPHLLELHTLKYDQQGNLQPRNSTNENQCIFSDYQQGGGGRDDGGQLPAGGGYNITANKLGEKIKNKTELQKSSSRNALNLADSHYKAASVCTADSATETERDTSRMGAALEALSSEVARLNQRLLSQEDRMAKLEKVKKEEGSGGNFSATQMEEISKILSLVQKSQQRDDYKRTIRMIDELRGNILDLHSQIKELQPYQQALPNNIAKIIKDIVAESMKDYTTGVFEMRGKLGGEMANIQTDVSGMRSKLSQLEEQWGEWKSYQNDQKEGGISISSKKFEGKLTTLLYEERLSCFSGSPNKISKGDSSDKENAVSLTTRTYYIDSSGFLLDKNKFYLLNSNNQQIRLTEKEIGLLKRHALL